MNIHRSRIEPQHGHYTPPKPDTLADVIALMRAALHGDGDLLSLLPTAAYRVPVGPLGYSRRQILIVNQPDVRPASSGAAPPCRPRTRQTRP